MRLRTSLCAVLCSGPLICAAQVQAEPQKIQTRCGWFENPTPGNAWLFDKDGRWIISTQMGHRAEGAWPDFDVKPSQWVRTNGEHGHGCACMQVITDPKDHLILRIVSASVRPLNVCRNDPVLKEPRRDRR
jgi:hypothetical protein